MEYKKLGDIATYINGYAFKPEDRGTEGLPIIRIQDLTGNAYDLGFYDGKHPEKIEINNGDVLISWSASLGVYVWNRGKALLNQHIFKVAFNKVDVDKNYFVYAVRHKLNEMAAKAHGATMKHIIKKDFDAIQIPFPSLQEQAEISLILDKVAHVIEERREELSKLDTLIKARFVEMFGDPVYSAIDSKIELSDICEKITDGEHGSVARVANGHPFLNAKHILKTGFIDWKTITYIGDEDHQRIYKRCNPEKGDILLTTTGTIGNVAIMPECEEVSMDRGITLLKINRHKVTSEFVAEMLKHPSIQMAMGANVHASAIGHLFMNKVKKLPAVLPSMKKQIEFTTFVQQIDKSKATVQKALDETQLLFDSLMQQYFG